jgi:hypothetical protein
MGVGTLHRHKSYLENHGITPEEAVAEQKEEREEPLERQNRNDTFHRAHRPLCTG